MGELTDLIMTMREVRDDLLAEKDAGKVEEKEK